MATSVRDALCQLTPLTTARPRTHMACKAWCSDSPSDVGGGVTDAALGCTTVQCVPSPTSPTVATSWDTRGHAAKEAARPSTVAWVVGATCEQFKQTHTWTRMHTHAHTCAHMSTHARNTCAHMHTHARTCTQTHTVAGSCVWPGSAGLHQWARAVSYRDESPNGSSSVHALACRERKSTAVTFQAASAISRCMRSSVTLKSKPQGPYSPPPTPTLFSSASPMPSTLPPPPSTTTHLK